MISIGAVSLSSALIQLATGWTLTSPSLRAPLLLGNLAPALPRRGLEHLREGQPVRVGDAQAGADACCDAVPAVEGSRTGSAMRWEGEGGTHSEMTVNARHSTMAG